MNSTLDPRKQKIITFLVIIALICGYLFLQSYFILIAVSAILAFIFNPLYKWAFKKYNKTGLALTITVLALFFTFAIPISAVLYVTAQQTVQVLDIIKNATANSGTIQEAINQVINSLNSQLVQVPGIDKPPLNAEDIFSWLKTGAETILTYSLNFAKGLVGGVAGFFTNLIIFLYVFSSLLKNQKTILKILQDLNPLGKSTTDLYLDKMGAMTTAMVKGQFIIAIAQSLSGVTSLAITGMDFLAFWFVLLAFLSIIPLGGGIVLIPFGIVLILTGNVWQGVLILLWHFVITTNIDNILRPKFVPKSASLDPALTILSVFAGISIFGFLGIILGPVIMIVIVTTVTAYLEFLRTGQITIVNDKKESKKGFFKRLLARTSARK
jgi:predicted PurR-regulated permease PerM